MTLTLRDIPAELNAELQRRAASQHIPIDQVAVEAMQAGLGLKNDNPKSIQPDGLATRINERFAPLGGLEIPERIKEPIRDPEIFDE